MSEYSELVIRPYQPQDQDAVVQLWRECGLVTPQNDPVQDIARKCLVNPELFLVGMAADTVVATVMVGYDGHRGWINYLAVSPDLQKGGVGRRMMLEAEQRLKDQGCPKINLQVRTSNKQVIEFYQRIGFSVDDVVSLGKRLIFDEPIAND